MCERERKKKLLLIIPSITIGGIERVALSTTEVLKDIYDILVVYFYHGSIEFSFSVQTICLDVPFGTNRYTQAKALLLRNWKLSRIKRQFQPDISFAMGEVSSISNLMTKRKEFCVASVHGASSIPRTPLKKKFVACCFSKADDIICVSEQIKTKLASAISMPCDRFRTVYNPVDTARIRSIVAQRTERVTTAGKTVVLVGRLDANKNVVFAIDTISEIVQKHPDISLRIIGDGEEREALQAYANQLNLREQVVFTGFTEDPYIEMIQANALLSVSLSEGFSLVLAEALYCGATVVACDCQAGPREILAPDTPAGKVATKVEYAKYGVLLPPCFTTDTKEERQIKRDLSASALERVLFDADLSAAYREKGLLRAEDFSFAKYRETLIAAWEK